MPTIYVTDDTARIRIDAYGTATKTTGVEVPEAVAVELETTYKHRHLLRIVRDAPVTLAALEAPAAPGREPEPEPAEAPRRGRSTPKD